MDFVQHVKCNILTKALEAQPFRVATFLNFVYCITMYVLLYKAHPLLQQTAMSHMNFLTTIDELTLLYLSHYAELRHPINYNRE